MYLKMHESDHDLSDDSLQWSTGQFALEVQKPWVELIVSGSKTIEVRSYPLPQPLVHKRLWILQPPISSQAGVSSICNVIELNNMCVGRNLGNGDEECPLVVGWMVISSVKDYKSRDEFCLDQIKHRVPKESVYGWRSDAVVYGWCIERAGVDGLEDFGEVVATRRKRSLFQLQNKS